MKFVVWLYIAVLLVILNFQVLPWLVSAKDDFLVALVPLIVGGQIGLVYNYFKRKGVKA